MAEKSPSTESRPAAPGDLVRAVEAAQLLVAYSSETGLAVDAATVECLVEAKYRSVEGTWTAESEAAFWRAFNAMSKAIHPVTIFSLEATRPATGGGSTAARRTVIRCQLLAAISMALLLAAQIYWLIGSTANRELEDLYGRTEALQTELRKLRELKGFDPMEPTAHDAEITSLERQLSSLEHELDANYQLLQDWGVVWSLGGLKHGSASEGSASEGSSSLTDYRKMRDQRMLERMEDKIERLSSLPAGPANPGGPPGGPTEPDGLEEARQRREELMLIQAEEGVRDRLLLHMESADLVLSVFQLYFLPILYGLLGAVLFVLRTLSKEVQELTFSSSSEVNFRLRVTLGALAGLAVGWFFTPEGDETIISALALSFLAGYNVEVLFSLMDKVISKLVAKDDDKPPPGEEPQKGSTAQGTAAAS